MNYDITRNYFYIRYWFLSLLCAVFTVSCVDKYDCILSQADNCIKQNPDSALNILEQITIAGKLSENDYYHYILLKTEAKNLLKKNIYEDTLIVKAKEYYVNKQDYLNSAKASLFVGNMYFEQKNYDKALTEYLEAESYSNVLSEHDDLKSDIQSAIGNIYRRNILTMKQANERYSTAYSLINRTEDIKRQLILLQSLGSTYLHLHNDSALICFEKAKEISEKTHGSQINNLVNIAIAYSHIADNDKAIEYTIKALSLSKNKEDSITARFNIAQYYNEANRLDSARQQFIALLNDVSGKDKFYEMNIYASLSDIEKKKHNYKEALVYFTKYDSLLVHIRNSNEIYNIKEIEDKYNHQLLINENKQILIDNQRIVLILLFAILIIVFITAYLYYKYKQNKKLLSEANTTISQLDEMAKMYDEKEISFRSVLLQHFNILKKVALIDGYLSNDEKKQGDKYIKKINSIVYGQNELDWQLLYKSMNDLHNSFFDILKEKYPQLDESEFRICCLSYAGFTNTEAAIILKLSVNTIQMKRTSIRKKIGIKETGGNIEDFLIKNIVNKDMQ